MCCRTISVLLFVLCLCHMELSIGMCAGQPATTDLLIIGGGASGTMAIRLADCTAIGQQHGWEIADRTMLNRRMAAVRVDHFLKPFNRSIKFNDTLKS